jgi:hypothetical protein
MAKPISADNSNARIERKIMPATDPVRELLAEKGCPSHIIEGGLSGLIENWEAIVESVSEGYALTLDDYLNDMDARQLLEEALAVAPLNERKSALERVRAADETIKAALEPAGRCLWGDEVAEEEGWAPQKNWWYFSKPVSADPELLAEIEEG